MRNLLVKLFGTGVFVLGVCNYNLLTLIIIVLFRWSIFISLYREKFCVFGHFLISSKFLDVLVTTEILANC